MNKQEIKTLIKPETGIEEAIIASDDFILGVNWGRIRSGHPEGQVIYHIEEVLGNIEKYYANDEDRSSLRIIALVHDTFKYKVDQTKPKVGINNHGVIASLFAEKYINNITIFQIIEYHDEAYNAWQIGGRHGNWYEAERRANRLIQGLLLVGGLDLYVKFYRCDNETGDKEQDNYKWFINLIK